MSKETYQKLYDNSKYGDHEKNLSPEFRWIELYQKHLISPVISLGCGRGGSVLWLREHGYWAEGIDQIELNNGMLVGNICEPLKVLEDGYYRSAICMDVFEHVPDKELEGLCGNLAKVEKQVISIHMGSSPADYFVKGMDEELHINIRTAEDWRSWLRRWFIIDEEKVINRLYHIYLCRTNKDDKSQR